MTSYILTPCQVDAYIDRAKEKVRNAIISGLEDDEVYWWASYSHWIELRRESTKIYGPHCSVRMYNDTLCMDHAWALYKELGPEPY